MQEFSKAWWSLRPNDILVKGAKNMDQAPNFQDLNNQVQNGERACRGDGWETGCGGEQARSKWQTAQEAKEPRKQWRESWGQGKGPGTRPEGSQQCCLWEGQSGIFFSPCSQEASLLLSTFLDCLCHPPQRSSPVSWF